ncbi:MAG TPA: BatD family protein [Bdellovibrio sp.]|uniref:BatD family protein n=1 Tax=Bdellovibrio sp. TaxID=28201 RepID=UPI002EF4A014
MVKAKYILLIMSVIPAISFAQSFSVNVDRDKVGLGEPLNANFVLTDTSASSSPDFSALNQNFQIIGQQQSSNIQIINGNTSSSTSWNLTLVPRSTGAVDVPSVTIQTKSGVLKTEPVHVTIQDRPVGTTTSQANAQVGTMSVQTADINPYKGQRILVNFQLAGARSLRNIQLGDFSVKDAIVERHGEPRVVNKTINGRSQQVVEVSYLVTPLKDGEMTLPSLVVRAEAPSRRNKNQAVDQDNPFAQMEQMMDNFANDDFFGGFASMQPVLISSRPLTLKVRPAVQGMDPWLPTSDLKLSETWSGQAKVGEPLTRVITTEVADLSSTQLPSFSEQMKSVEDYKVYADHPVTSEKSFPGGVASIKKETLTIIPQASGSLRFPALKLEWWDTKNHVRRIATLPERTVQVAPGIGGGVALNQNHVAQKNLVNTATENHTAPVSSPMAPTFAGSRWNTLFMIGAGLLLLALSLAIVYFIRRKQKTPQTREVKVERKSVDVRQLKQAQSCREVLIFLQSYAEAQWGLERQAPLSRIFSRAADFRKDFDKDLATNITRRIEGELYAGQRADLEMIKKDVEKLIMSKHQRQATQKAPKESLPELNPE